MAQFLLDNFTDSAGTDITSHAGETGATWTNHGSYTGTVVISNANRARKNDVSSVAPYASGTPLAADYEVITRLRFVTVVTAEFRGVAGRINTAANTLYWAAWNNNNWTLRKVVAGSSTTLGTVAVSVSAGEDWLLKLRMVGTSIKLLAKGPSDPDYVEIIGVTDASISAAGRAGLIGVTNNQTNTTGAHWDYVEASDILAAPVATLGSVTDTTINASAADPASGTGPFSWQWYRSTTSGFTPGGGNALSGQTANTLADSTAVAGTTYHYKAVSTDSAGSPNVLTSNQLTARRTATIRNVGFIGDSITDGAQVATKPGTLVAAKLNLTAARLGTFENFVATNQGVSGSRTQDWLSGSGNLTTAKSAFSGASVTHVHIMLGTNDCKDTNAISAATYLSNLTSLVNDLVGAGYVVILSYPPGINPGVSSGFGEAAIARLESYQASIDGLLNGTTILRGSTVSYLYFAQNPGQLAADGVHMSTNGNDALAMMWAGALEEVFNPAPSPARACIIGG